jgi:hypothetical protein
MSTHRKRFGFIRISIIGLALAAALIHLGLALPSAWPFSFVFAMNGIGYLALLAGLYLELPVVTRYRGAVRLLFVLYTLVTIALFFVMNTTYGTFGLVTKGIEVLLVVSLLIEYYQKAETVS